jgi:hypothetical protein
MFRSVVAFLLLAGFAHAATIRLYLKDGSYHLVTEYKKLEDRVRFYSIERGDWEEIPLNLMDLERTQKEVHEKEAEQKEQAAIVDAEEKAERAQRREVERVPMNPGVYMVEGEKVTTLKQTEELKAVSDKKRSILKAITPIPIVAGKSTVEMEGAQSATVLAGNRPEFYFRLATDERFGIVRLEATKDSRIVQKWSIVPVTKEIVEETNFVEVFKQQLADGLYKIWPMKPLEPGQYAVVEFTDGKGNIQAWDFAIR